MILNLVFIPKTSAVAPIIDELFPLVAFSVVLSVAKIYVTPPEISHNVAVCQ